MPRTVKKGIQNRVRSAFQGARERVEGARDRAEEYVREHPTRSIIIAAGVGAAVAVGVTLLMTRSRERSFWDRIFGLF